MALKRVRYVGPYPEVELQNTVGEWVTVANGATIDVSSALAASLCEQPDNWQPVTARSEKGDG
jgi:hypothetical protein